jgi:hypothetical protein
MTIHLFNYGDIHEVMWNSILSNIFTLDENVQDQQLQAEMQIYVSAVLQYQVQSRITSRDAVLCSRMAEITMLYTMAITEPNLLQSYTTENSILNEIPTETPTSRDTQQP